MTAAGRLGVGIIGAGRVGPVLGAGLSAAGHAITGIATLTESNRERAQAMLPDAPILEIPQLIERSELVLLAIPESQIEALVAGLAATGTWQPGQLLMHTAAGLGYGVLQPATLQGVIPLAVHPAMSFTGTSMDLVRLRESFCAVTAPTPVLPIAQALVVELGAEPFVVAEADRAAYAEAISTATSFSSEIVRQSIDLLAGIGLEAPGAVIAPLVRSAVENALHSPPTAAQFPPDPDFP
ncbi:putative short-subunit dehydrogenase-like oxidoreductase (DUF2520 family) [Leifsonia sp. AK011]|uniref:Rossmann-like and DUF2520 domain-containing protein n=1 Tax=Leifsonia sp. AK011 TaxID=2723075 RepID=UPI0015CCBEDB|nr:Rossmann-like and DUF2520 domain-containing protein [Leifsonia sp. AK011]NYF09557.1 putative short-subunit dehydrogenase-like oxidoreductase (DUF2520 family) [Leifsonia sp. AK011]